MYVHIYIGSAVCVYMSMGSAIMCTCTWLSGVCTHVYMGSAVYTHGFSCVYTCTWAERCMYTHVYTHGFSCVYTCTWAERCMYTHVYTYVYTHGFSCVYTCTRAERCMYTHVHGSAIYASVQRRQLSSRARCVTTFDADVNRCVGGQGVMCDRFLREKKGFLTLCLTLTLRERATVSHANKYWKR